MQLIENGKTQDLDMFLTCHSPLIFFYFVISNFNEEESKILKTNYSEYERMYKNFILRD